MDQDSNFKSLVIQVVKQIPYGKVASYGQIALYAQSPRSARQVGWILNKYTKEEIPWWRVINNTGRISIKGSQYTPHDQMMRLQQEGIVVNEDFTIDINKYRWLKKD